MKNVFKRPVAAFALSMIIFGTIGLFRRAVPLPSDAFAFSRGILGTVFLLLFMRIRGKSFDLAAAKKHALLLILTGAMIGLNWILLFEAYNYTSLAVATLSYYMQPVIVILLSPILLKEKISLKKGICILVSVCGMILVSGIFGSGTAGADNTRGVLLGLGAASLYAGVVILNKKITDVPVYEKTIIQLASAAIALSPYMLLTGSFRAYELGTVQVICLLTAGIVHTGAAYALYFGAVEKMPAQTAAILSYIDPVTAVLLSALLLHEALPAVGMIGAVMIIGSALVSEIETEKPANTD